jgi:UDP-N-acetyl-D-mannosaminuronate dehydrogenase
MAKDTILIVGLGEVGHTLYEMLSEAGRFDVHGFDTNRKKMEEITQDKELFKNADVMHICYPCTDQNKFIKTTVDYVKKAKPRLTIIESTVPPNTTRRIYEATEASIADSPIRGMHKSVQAMKKDVLYWTKYVGGTTKQSAEDAKRHFEKLGLKVKVLRSSTETELAKLFETVYRAWMIACFQEMHRISRHYDANFDNAVDMLEDNHRVDFNKPLHYPDVIGGHCLIQNSELLLKSYDSDFLRLILESNEKRKQEIKDPTIRKEVEKVRKRVEKLERELSRRNQ